MKKILALCASVALLGSVVAAQAADVQLLTAKQMDGITAGQTVTGTNTSTQSNTANVNQTATANGAFGNAQNFSWIRQSNRNQQCVFANGSFNC
jgi:opacity protein-like surface antigen